MSPSSLVTQPEGKRAYLWVGVGPLGVVLLAWMLFEWIAPPDVYRQFAPESFVVPGTGTGIAGLLADVKARYAWLTTVLLNLFISLFAMVLFFRVTWRSLEKRQRTAAFLVLTALSIGGLGSLLQNIAGEGALHRVIYDFTFDALRSSGRYTPSLLDRVALLLKVTNLIAVIAPNCALVAVVAAMMPRSANPSLKDLRVCSRHLRETINASAALLVAGILHMNTWLRWSASFVADAPARNGVELLSLALSLYWGLTFSLMIGAAFLPANLLLRHRALRLREQTGNAEEPPEAWLKTHGFKFSPAGQLPQIAMMIAPALAGPAASLFGSLTDWAK